MTDDIKCPVCAEWFNPERDYEGNYMNRKVSIRAYCSKACARAGIVATEIHKLADRLRPEASE